MPRAKLIAFVREVVETTADPAGPCLLWPYAVNPDGYGRIEISRRSRPAHQVVLEESGQCRPFPAAEVRHLCGVRRCVALGHLKWGTRSENQADRFRHGATFRGAANPHARLSPGQVAEIREAVQQGLPDALLARRYQVAPATIWMIRTGRTWQD